MPPIIAYTPIQQEAPVTAPKHLITLEAVEQLLSGKIKAPVRVVASTPQTGTYAATPDFEFTYTALEALEIDGVALVVGDRVLLAAQATATENGIYVVTDAGEDGPTPPAAAAVLKRATDFDDDSKIQQGVSIGVMEGTTQANTTWRLTTAGTITLDSTALDFVSVTPSTGAAKFAETITGDSVKDVFTVKHDLGSTDVNVQIYNLANHALVLTDVTVVDANNVDIGFADPPPPSDVFRVVVVG